MYTKLKVSLREKEGLIILGVLLFSVLVITYFFSQESVGEEILPITKSSVYLYKQEEKYLSVDTNSKIPDIPVISSIRLVIPVINIDSVIGYVGLTSLGAMGAPKSPDEVVLFDPGPNPGEKGNAVIAGHYGWKNGIPAVFDSLNKLKEGDDIYIENEKGVKITFVVREIILYGENDDSSKVFLSNDGRSHLNLITCGGIYNKNTKSYSNRLVVFSDKE
ncbi:MAG: class F sortase [Candidatus Paceibacterota bacterium]|jgi:LPXTG-site transpeptidase (sortase) family protein